MAALQGATVVVPAGVVAVQVLGSFTLPYELTVTPGWPTERSVAAAAKLATGFTVVFAVPSPVGGSSFDWVSLGP